ncbi:MAG: NAD(P)/FAD-dependent oxidoreductase [Alphaproteobacteria bacterium]|nr:NAD(P)/FAD-dependent oxidoreductase [Alphaproteobacteria bacterium]
MPTAQLPTPDIETIVVGGGVVGLAAARSLAARGMEVMLIERHDRTGTETSSRNSEVIHAGLYYPKDSLRARLCVAGRHQLYEFAAENGVAVNRCGKLVVATGEEDLASLERIAQRAQANGVCDIAMLDGAAAQRLEPEVACIAALHSPSTGVIDSHGLITALEGHLTAGGGSIVLSTEVTSIAVRPDGLYAVTALSTGSSAERTTAQTTITAKNLVLAAGLAASDVAKSLKRSWRSGYVCPATYLAKGHYFTLAARAPFSRLIYPLPTGAWLGIHLTLDIAGQAKFGPDLTWIESLDYAFEDQDGERRRRFVSEIRRYWPSLPAGALQPGYTGIRPKIYAQGEPPADFAIHGPATHGRDRLVALYGIESPGLTSSLAIGDYVADMLLGPSRG